jgi:hypothetical protein
MNKDNADVYDVHVLRCFACEAKALAEDSANSEGGSAAKGLYFVAEREVTGHG